MNHRQRVSKGLSTPMNIAGGSRKPVILNGILAVMTVFASMTLWYLPLFIMTHGFIVYATKKDPQWFEILARYLKNKKNYRS